MKTPSRLCLTREGDATLVPPVARGSGHPGSMPVPPGECLSILDKVRRVKNLHRLVQPPKNQEGNERKAAGTQFLYDHFLSI